MDVGPMAQRTETEGQLWATGFMAELPSSAGSWMGALASPLGSPSPRLRTLTNRAQALLSPCKSSPSPNILWCPVNCSAPCHPPARPGAALEQMATHQQGTGAASALTQWDPGASHFLQSCFLIYKMERMLLKQNGMMSAESQVH